MSVLSRCCRGLASNKDPKKGESDPCAQWRFFDLVNGCEVVTCGCSEKLKRFL